ncbi:MAG: hypothetical protein HKO66_05770 [Saprospiraceae bacterium]|nr:hypothetical protein [Bacteroidia bacterium]NNE14755.1 hypothetical protein [Saprospiraceae bacterium]NNL91718.1 hypothetical protein [Saprospiraceae bacterium]
MKGEELIALLVQLSRSDNNFDDFEFSYILQVGQALGMNQLDIEDAIRYNTRKEVGFPKTEQDRMNILYHMLFLMKIDKNVSPKEAELIHHYGFKLGFSKSMLDEFITVITDYAHERVPTEKMLDIIRKYQN